jgi:hypothetical protein
MRPETFGIFGPPLVKSGGWRPFTELEKPAIGGHSPTIRGGFSERPTGWLGRKDSNLRMMEAP